MMHGTINIKYIYYNADVNYMCIYIFSMALQPNAGHGLLILEEVSILHTTTHHIR